MIQGGQWCKFGKLNVPCISIFGCVSYDDNSGTEEQPPSAKRYFLPGRGRTTSLEAELADCLVQPPQTLCEKKGEDWFSTLCSHRRNNVHEKLMECA